MITLHHTAVVSATHQIDIAGELEPVHGHDFRCVASVATTDPGADPSLLIEPVGRVLTALAGTDLSAVAKAEGGRPSAERISRYVLRRLEQELGDQPEMRVVAVTIHESPGCRATFRPPR